jgi:hypothetical protein
MYSSIATAKMDGVDPRAWLVDMFPGIADQPSEGDRGLRSMLRGYPPSAVWQA